MYPTNVISLPNKAELFYKDVLTLLNASNASYLIGGSLALAHYMHLPRSPKDLDIFLRREDVETTLELLKQHGYETLVVHSHWLAKAYKGDLFIDFIFNSGNGVALVDDDWFEEPPMGEIFGQKAPICRPEDIIWSKAFIMDRERFDGADIAHLIRDASAQINWQRLLDKFGSHWRVLFAHLMLYQFIYPGNKAIPQWVIDNLLALATSADESLEGKLCQGTLLSRDQYSSDVEMYGYADGRLAPEANMNQQELSEYLCAVDLEVSTRKRLEKEVNRKFDLAQQAIANKVHSNKKKGAAA